MRPKSHILRMDDAQWRVMAAHFAAVVPPERKPPKARHDSEWQVLEGLRMIAAGELTISPPSAKE